MKYLKKQKLKNDLLIAFVITALLGFGAFYLPQFFILKKWQAASVDIWAGVILGVLAMVFYNNFSRFFDKKMDRLFDQSMCYKRGIVGEQIVFEKLKEILGDNVQMITSVVTGNYGDTDIVVVCQKGVLVIEVKNWSDEIFIKNGKLWRNKFGGKQWQLLEKDPFMQVCSQARGLDEI